MVYVIGRIIISGRVRSFHKINGPKVSVENGVWFKFDVNLKQALFYFGMR